MTNIRLHIVYLVYWFLICPKNILKNNWQQKRTRMISITKKLCQNEPKKKSVKYNQKLSTLLYILLYYTPRCMYYYYVCTQLLSWGPIRKHYWITHLTSPRGKMNSSKVRQGTTQAKPTCPFKKLQKWQTTPSGELLEHFFMPNSLL